jgi:GMP synthase (glutamine-hydrolysing)
MNKIAILDFGGQYTHLIARKVRQLGLYSEIYHTEDFDPNNDKDIVGIIFSGGPQSVNKEDAYNIGFDIDTLKIPVLGICYGHQLIASLVGGTIESGKNKEYGFTQIECDENSLLFKGIDTNQTVWMSHGDYVDSMPDNFIITAGSESVKISAYESKDCTIFGMQFHPEVAHTENGLAMLDNFLSVCTKERDWKARDYESIIEQRIREETDDKNLFLLLSGGVDSLVALMLCINAIGKERVYPLHINTGFMRLNESAEIKEHLKKLGFENLKIVNAEYRFLAELKGVVDPEEKRKIIGRLFVELMHEELIKLNVSAEDWILVQGTIYPDTIESGQTKKSSKIKTHHNRVPEIEELIEKGRVIEPLKELYKDEVRKIGKQLNLPEHLVERHPFPGPGLAIRILASDRTTPTEETYLEADILKEKLKPLKLTGKILPVKSVGVQGDYRTYHHPAVIWYDDIEQINPYWGALKRSANRLINQLTTVNRVIFSYKPVKTKFTLRKTYLVKEQADLLRKVDYIVTEKLLHIKEIWQLPVVSLPLWDDEGNQVFVIRPICSQDAMTADVYEMNFDLLKEIIKEVNTIDGVGYLFYDLTTKPPGTIEWE